MTNKFEDINFSKELEETVQQTNLRVIEIESKLISLDDEIKEFFDKPLDTKIATNLPLNESMMSLKQNTESGRFSVSDIYELKNRFNRLQYDCNRSIHGLREQIKDVIDNKITNLQKQVLNNMSSSVVENVTTNQGLRSPQKVIMLELNLYRVFLKRCLRYWTVKFSILMKI